MLTLDREGGKLSNCPKDSMGLLAFKIEFNKAVYIQ